MHNPTIDFIDCDTEEQVHSPMLVMEKVTDNLQAVTDFLKDHEMKDSIPNPRILESTYVLDSSTSAFVLSSIQNL